LKQVSKVDKTTRLNKFLALRLGISRREADSLIEQGKVKLRGKTAVLGSRVSPTDTITINNKPLGGSVPFRYIMLHKPTGYVSSRRAQGEHPTIYSLLPKEFHALKLVGRLDKDSSGLILITNDGDFAYQMTHPKFYKTKVYEVTLDRELEPLHQQMINELGVQLEDGKSQLHLERLNDNNRKEWQVIMTEGRNRQIRRTFAALGYTVTKLHRTYFGTYSLAKLQRGEYCTVEKT
jgi:pseudouridine synthase